MMAVSISTRLAHLLTLASLTSALVISHPDYQHGRHNHSLNPPNEALEVLKRQNSNQDPADFSWVSRWAAIGDSFTAGIGSGQLYSREKEDWRCSRYDHSYPAIINNALGPTVDNFQFVACSGDRSQQIYQQVQNMNGNLDLVILTAGGNDLCLAGIIKACVFYPKPFVSETSCQAIIDKAQENIDTILKPNLKEILLSLNSKMRDNSVVVYNGYAQFFNTDNEDCATKQDWSFPKLFWIQGLKLTVDRRKKFNTLVENINKAIKEVIDDVTENEDVKYKIGMSDWDPWAREAVEGQFCHPSSTGRVPDPKQVDLQFYKPDTYVSPLFHDELRKRMETISPEERALEEKRELLMLEELRKNQRDIHDSLLWNSADPRAEALHKLNPRAPAPPNCPGDGGIDWSFGLGLPDAYGKYFHPNEMGHETISAFALDAMINLRAQILGRGPVCEMPEEFKCWQQEGRRGYANANRMDENYKDFCNNHVSAPDNTVGWKAEKTYHQGTPDEHSFLLQLSSNAGAFDKDECLDSFNRIIHGCDGNDPENPLNWKFGGRYKRGEYTYEVNIRRDNRPWPPIKQTHGSCKGWYKVFFSAYELRGAGWSTWDSGQQTILPNMKGCLGLGITAWKFNYYDEPDSDGMEWGLSFNTPIWVRSRCFKNNKVAMASGGFTDGCGGND